MARVQQKTWSSYSNLGQGLDLPASVSHTVKWGELIPSFCVWALTEPEARGAPQANEPWVPPASISLVHTCASQRSMLGGVFHCCFPPYFLRQGYL